MTYFTYIDREIDDDCLIELAVGLGPDGDVVSVDVREGDLSTGCWVSLPADVAAQIDMNDLAEEAREMADLAARGWP